MKRKILLAVLGITLALCMFCFIACSNSNTQHSHSYAQRTVPPTCTEKGYTCNTCSCGDSYNSDYVDELGHEFTNYISNNDATQDLDGTETAKCNRNGCSATDTQTDLGSMLSHTHSYNENITAPTCTQKGYTTYICSCGDSYIDNYVDEISHNFVNKTCSVCSYLKTTEGLNYTLSEDESYYIVDIGTATDKDIVIADVYNNLPVKEINQYAFHNSDITSVFIPQNIIDIKQSAFWECSYLETVTFASDSKLENIGDCAFQVCKKLESITIPKSVKNLDAQAFLGCTNLATVVFENESELVSIGSNAFAECTNLNIITIPKCVKRLEYGVFHNCINLETVIFENESGLKKIDDYTFAYCVKLCNIIIPNTVTEIGVDTFLECEALNTNSYDNAKYFGSQQNPYLILLWEKDSTISSCAINPQTKTIASNAFYNCTNLQAIEIPKSVTHIGGSAFITCTNLSILTFENNSKLVSVGRYAFMGTKLQNLTIPESVKNIGEGAFSHCSNLENITVEEGNSVYHSVNNCIVHTEGLTLILGCKNSIIPSDGSVLAIGENAFAGCLDLQSIYIPEGIEIIAFWAFVNCINLQNISIPNSIKFIDSSAFENCSQLIKVDEVTYLGNDSNSQLVLYHVPDMPSFFMACNIKLIIKSAFADCNSLAEIVFDGSMYQFMRLRESTDLLFNEQTITIRCNDGDVVWQYGDYIVAPRQ